MSSMLLVLSPEAKNPETARGLKPFSCNKTLQEIFNLAEKEVNRLKNDHGYETCYEHYVVFEDIFCNINAEFLHQKARIKLSQSVYMALIDCNVFGNLTSAINTLWIIVSFLGGNVRTINENKLFFILDHKDAKKYQRLLLGYSKIVKDEYELAMYLEEKLNSINMKELAKQHPRD